MNGFEYLCLGGFAFWILAFGLTGIWICQQVYRQDRAGSELIKSYERENIALRAEVERLNAEHDRIYEALQDETDTVARVTAENTRLRAALEKLTDHRTNHILNIKQVQDIARAALMAVQE